jgi:uncharacterized protein (TIGR02145 family)
MGQMLPIRTTCATHFCGPGDQEMASFLMVHCDEAVKVWVDGDPVGTVLAGEYKKFEVSPGWHALKVESLDAARSWNDKRHVPAGEQVLVEPTLMPSDLGIGLPAKLTLPDESEYMTTLIPAISMEWMAQNLGSSRGKPLGPLYHYREAVQHVPRGWRLPSLTDCERLLAVYDDGAFEALTSGRSGFNAQFNGEHEGPVHSDHGTTGVYWTSTPAATKLQICLYFNKNERIVSLNKHRMISVKTSCSVRYCRDSV